MISRFPAAPNLRAGRGQVRFRSGDPTSEGELFQAGAHRASRVITLSQTGIDAQKSDAQMLRQVLSLRGVLSADEAQPQILVELQVWSRACSFAERCQQSDARCCVRSLIMLGNSLRVRICINGMPVLQAARVKNHFFTKACLCVVAGHRQQTSY